MMSRKTPKSIVPRLILLALLPLSVLLLFLSGRVHTPSQGVADSMMAGVYRAGAASSRSFWGAVDALWHALGASEEIRRLEDEVTRLRADLAYQQARALDLAQEQRQLRQWAERQGTTKADLATSARVIEAVGVAAWCLATDTSSCRYSLLIDRGEEHGIRAGAAVAAGGVLVGKVTSAHRTTSRVILTIDPGFRTAIRFLMPPPTSPSAPPRAGGPDAVMQGILCGVQRDLCRVHSISRDAPLAPGDLAVTSGLDGQFPSGLLLGKVVRVKSQGLFLEADVEPAVRMDSLRSLLVLQPMDAAKGLPTGKGTSGDR